MDEAVRRVTGAQLAQLMFPHFDHSGDHTVVAKGIARLAGCGGRRGRLRLRDRRGAGRRGRDGDPGPPGDQPRRPARHDRRRRASSPAAAARPRTRPSSPAAWARPASAAPRRSTVDTDGRPLTVRTAWSSREGDGLRSTAPPARSTSARCRSSRPRSCEYFEGRLARRGRDDDLVEAVHRIMTHADERRRLAVRTNADTAEDAARARRFGAQGIGLCRTEHMFLGDRRELVERLILAEHRRGARGRAGRAAAAAARRTSSRSSRRWTACRSPSG